MRAKDMTGQRFGRLVVLGRAEQSKWRCRCDCGNEVAILGGNLQKGFTKSCGCLNSELSADRKTIHGGYGTRLYKEWSSIKDRCYRPKTAGYDRYGGRGITMCDEWLDNFGAFRDWAMANGYRDDLTIDRKDNNGPYSPENCRWITLKEQQNNRSNNTLITCWGRTQTLQQWADETKISRHTISARLKRGWDTERALTEPVKN